MGPVEGTKRLVGGLVHIPMLHHHLCRGLLPSFHHLNPLAALSLPNTPNLEQELQNYGEGRPLRQSEVGT